MNLIMTMHITWLVWFIALFAGPADMDREIYLSENPRLSGGGSGEAEIFFQPGPESRVWIEGSSNLNDFRCEVRDVDNESLIIYQNQSFDPLLAEYIGEGIRNYELRAAESRTEKLRVGIAVRNFDCGKRKMNRDLNETLNSDEHPEIGFQFVDARVINIHKENGEEVYTLEVSGELTIAGVTQAITFNTEAEHLEGYNWNVAGKAELLLSDYQISPPAALFGLIRVSDHMTVNFDLIIQGKEKDQ